jgi:hypothetical protein
MTLSAIVSRWFGLTSSSARPTFGPAAIVPQHYEEEDEYGDFAGPDEGTEADRTPQDAQQPEDGYFRPSKLFAPSYEEEAAHLRDDNEGLLEADELLIEA